MESLTKPVTLTQDVTRVLDEIRAGAENALYGAGPDVSEKLFHEHVASLIEGAGLPLLQTMHYRWFLRELARLWRTRQGRDLAFHLELCIRKWVGLGLEARTLQFLVCEAHQRLKGKSEGRSGNDECRTESVDVQARISHPPITPIAEDSMKSVRNRNLRESVESVDETRGFTSAESADVHARISHPPITPIAEDSSSSVRNPNPNLRESVESVDDTPAPASASSAVGAFDARMCQPMSGPRPPADADHSIATELP